METTHKGRPVYKVLSATGESIHGGSLAWSLPFTTDEGRGQTARWHQHCARSSAGEYYVVVEVAGDVGAPVRTPETTGGEA